MDQNKQLKKKTLNLKVKSLETKTAPLRAMRAATSPVIGSS